MISLIKIHRQNLTDTFVAFVLACGTFAFGLAAILVVGLGALVRSVPGGGLIDGLIGALGTVVLGWSLFTGNQLIRDARASAARKANEIVKYDPRSPTLFLRSFEDEEIVVRPERPFGFFWPIPFVLLNWIDQDLALRWISRPRRLEEVVVSSVYGFGPPVTIARPNAPLELGAARAYVDDSRWQDEVMLWIKRAAILIVEVGTTPGVRWEFQRIIENNLGSKVVLILPPQQFARRSSALRDMLANTQWDASLHNSQICNEAEHSCLAIVLLPNASILAITSKAKDALNYTAATQIASSIVYNN
jgi:hypothetical protein